MTIQAIIHPAEEGGFWAEVPSLPGCLTEGESLDELKTNLIEAVKGWMEAAEDLARRKLEPDASLLALAV